MAETCRGWEDEPGSEVILRLGLT
ncbi:MAG: hypothetical protein QOI38_2345, partial [Sphingomonadales bacterium]|nr:hypothetical protein [Sphingomonadales bacterium]